MIKRIVIAVVVVLILIVAGGLTFVLHSQSVLRWTVARALARTPEITIQQVEGTLAGPITLEGVAIQSATFDARVETLTLDWQVSALLAKHLRIRRLALDGVDMVVKGGGAHRAFKLELPAPPKLPVSIAVRALVVDNLQIQAPGLAVPLHVAHATLSARLSNRAWSVRNLQVRGSQIQVSGQGNWQLGASQRLSTRVQWKLQLPQLPAFAGSAKLEGDPQTLKLTGSLAAPFELHLAGEIRTPFTAPAWRGTLDFGGLDPRALRASWPEISAAGKLEVRGDPQATELTGDISAHEPTYGLWKSHVDFSLTGRTLEIKTLALARSSTATRFDLAGQVLYEHGRFEPALHGEWRALPVPLTGTPWFTSPKGRLSLATGKTYALLSVTGSLAGGGQFSAQGNVNLAAPHDWKLNASASQFRFALANFNAGQALPPVDFKFRGHGDRSQTVVDQLDAAWLGGRIQAHGQLAHSAGQRWRFALAAEHINPGALYPRFPGDLSGQAELAGASGATANLSVKVERLRGELRHVPLEASGTLSHRTSAWTFQDLVVASGKNHLQLDGQYGQGTRLNWTLVAPELGTLAPEFHGSLTSQGHADFSAGLPVIAATLKASDLQYEKYGLKSLELKAQLSGASPDNRVELRATGLQIGKVQIASLQGDAAGPPAAHTLKLALASAYGRLEIAGHGQYRDHAWQGELTDVSLAPTDAGEWKNSAAWQIGIAGRHLRLAQGCLTQGEASTCLQADWQPGTWQANATIKAVPTADLQALLPRGLAYTGNFGASVHIAEAAGERQLELDAELSPGAIYNVIEQHRATLLAYNAGHLKLHSDPALTIAHLDWTLTEGGYLNVDTQIENDNNLALTGTIKGELHDFQLVPALMPAIGSLHGQLAIDLELGGTPSDPHFNGHAVFSSGELGIPRYGLKLTDLMVKLAGNGNHLTATGSARSGDGTLAWQSSLTRSAQHWQAEGELTGQNFRVANTPEVQLAISPQISLKLDNHDLTLDGKVTIPHARLAPRDLSQTAGVTPDQVIVGVQPPPPNPWRIHAQVTASMGPDVQFEGFGLSGRITGSVQAIDAPGKPTTGNGTLEIVGGRFAAFGQKLNIERGRLLFSGGPIADPALDIRAIRPPARGASAAPRASEQQVGVLVRGPLQHPRISLFSQPPLPQSQMMSYLLTGQTGVNQNVSPLIGMPVTSNTDMNEIVAGNLVASELGAQIGVNDVSVQNVTLANGSSASAVFLGKFLSPRLYVSYGTILGQSLNTLRIQYTLSARWMLEAETGFASGADLIYSIER
ncbi:MAG: translocation/assembly module TamB domain-containing protein [Gammaproteobacteria bacterium]